MAFLKSGNPSGSITRPPVIRIHSHQYGVMRFPIDKNRLELSYLNQYFPGSTGVACINEKGETVTVTAFEDSNGEYFILVNKNIDYVVSYQERKHVSPEALIEGYFYQQYSYAEICKMLSSKHGLNVSIKHLQRYLSNQVLKRKNIKESPLQKLVATILWEVTSSGMNLGYRSLWRRLRDTYRFNVKQTTVLKLLRIIDPQGVKMRSRRRLRRRAYSVPGPNHIWHADGYDKLKPYGFAIHSCVDGFSRKILWLRVGTTNNKPEIIAHHYLKLIAETGFVPAVLRVDAGTENTVTGLIQQALRHKHEDRYAGKESFVVGPSTANQRVEKLWGEARNNTIGFYIDFFKTMIGFNVLNNKDVLDRELLRFCFAHLIDEELTRAQHEWNSHRLRAQTSRGLPSGIPNVMYHAPAYLRAKDCKKPVDKCDVKRILERFAIQPELYTSKTKDLVTLLMPEATTPANPQEAFTLFSLLKTKLNQNISDGTTN